MGITINYRGTLNNKNLVSEFCDELADISESMNWKYSILDNDVDNLVYGFR